jgi:hydrogenase large subunit
MKKIIISPITRVNGPWHLEILLEGNLIIEANSSGTFYRGIEEILLNRDPMDTAYLTARICGICSVAHSITASTAIETAVKHELPKNAILIRNLLYGTDILQNHLRHIYVLTLLDYVKGPDKPPFIPRYEKGYRLPKNLNQKLIDHYFQSFDLHRKAHEMVTLFGGKAPHNHGVVPGGATVHPTSGIIKSFTAMLTDIKEFIDNQLMHDMEMLKQYYNDYYEIGKTPGNFITYGMFPIPDNVDKLHFSPGVIFNKSKELQDFNGDLISEYVRHSYFTQDKKALHPTNGITKQNFPKKNAYSWVKAPRYQNKPMEAGPIARLWANKYYQNNTSTLDRIIARALEAKMVCELIFKWVEQLEPGKPIHNPISLPKNFEGQGLTEAMRGALGHWIKVSNGKISHYQIITPSAWNCSPKDDNGIRGTIEEALVGTAIDDIDNPIEIGRIVRSFDPCLSCAAHTIQGKKIINTFII